MKTASFIGVGIVLAQLCAVGVAQALPDCGAQCFAEGLQASLCTPTDATCVCADASLQAYVGACVQQQCDIIDALASKNATATLCHEPVRDSRKTTIIMTAVCGSLAVFFLGIRALICDALSIREMVFVSLGFLTTLPLVAMMYPFYTYGLGRDIWTLTPFAITKVAQATWLSELSYVVSICFTRLSFLALYLRVFPRCIMRRSILALAAVNIAHGTAFFLAVLLNCQPIQYTWEAWRGGDTGHCTSINAIAWSHAATTIALDLCVIGLPMPELWHLKIGTKKKISILIIFGVGFFITIVSVLRLHALVSFSTSTNPTWDNVQAVYWSVLEMYVSIICSCLPSFRAFLARVAPALVSSAGRSGYARSGYVAQGSGRDGRDRLGEVRASRGLRNEMGGTGMGVEMGMQGKSSNADGGDGADSDVELVMMGTGKGGFDDWRS